jgi:hypothetical protein
MLRHLGIYSQGTASNTQVHSLGESCPVLRVELALVSCDCFMDWFPLTASCIHLECAAI